MSMLRLGHLFDAPVFDYDIDTVGLVCVTLLFWIDLDARWRQIDMKWHTSRKKQSHSPSGGFESMPNNDSCHREEKTLTDHKTQYPRCARGKEGLAFNGTTKKARLHGRFHFRKPLVRMPNHPSIQMPPGNSDIRIRCRCQLAMSGQCVWRASVLSRIQWCDRSYLSDRWLDRCVSVPTT